MICQACRNAKPGASFWDGDTHHRTCLACRKEAAQVAARVAPYSESIMAEALKQPNRNIRLVTFAGVTGDILFVLQQLPDPADVLRSR